MKETKLWDRLRPRFLLWGECDRVENVVGQGMSDVFYNFSGKTGWVETKIIHSNGLIYFEKFQPNWIAKHHRQGARMFIIAMDVQDTIHIYPAGVILAAKRTLVKDWITVNTVEFKPSFSMPHPYRSWNSVRDILTS